MKGCSNEIRDPVHGLIPFNDIEKQIINHRFFQRLRRIRQLGWTEYVYPGAVHTRFEHSLGTMHVASRMFDAICDERISAKILREKFRLEDSDLQKARQTLRIAALVHDIGHAPYSHSSDVLFPVRDDGSRYDHEAYTLAALKLTNLGELIAGKLGAEVLERVCGLLAVDERARPEDRLFGELVVGPIDCDKIDYLQRDSLHCGVKYGQFDCERVINTVCVCPHVPDGEGFPTYRVGITQGGIEAFEGLLLARYLMFAAVYQHKIRIIAEEHYKVSAGRLGPNVFEPPTSQKALENYFGMDDAALWKRLEDSAPNLKERRHFRAVHHLRLKTEDDAVKARRFLERAKGALKASKIECFVCQQSVPILNPYSSKNLLVREDDSEKVTAFKEASWVVGSLARENHIAGRSAVYVAAENKSKAIAVLQGLD